MWNRSGIQIHTKAEIFDGSTPKHTIYIVTEPVMPLSEKIKELGLEGTQRDEYYAWGLRQISKAVHGNVCLASAVVTPTLDWKLHAFDLLSEFDGNNEVSTSRLPEALEFNAPSQIECFKLIENSVFSE
ncbi:hypothetical protein MKW98_014862 [Papaver atlanticum]|uniref:Uncharacterized protein n=1 Tax=Papaver atlanticum TaxID=357466 RepID=A0AAD4XD04_9MAGN|nr:hypothetical protein MKW98_014862 [Papaver atlanticum]